MKKFFLATLLLPLTLLGQNGARYQGLLWKISGNGLDKPSYLYGTMHVSNRVAFHLSESFFNALDQVDVIALEGNPGNWMTEMVSSDLIEDMNMFNFGYNNPYADLYSSFVPAEPSQSELAYYLAHDEDLLNGFLWRTSQVEQEFEEQTYLDLYIFQAGKKKGKKIVALEDFNESMKSVLFSGKIDEDAVRASERQMKSVLGDYKSWSEFQEDAYRKGDLNRLDTMTSLLNPGKYYRKNMLDVRNRIMANGIDSLLKHHSVFTGVGAAHLPGKNGVIKMLRDMGYTLEPIERDITKKSIAQKETIDELVYTYEPIQFVSDDGLISTTFPQQPAKIANSAYQEYLFADMANSAFYSIRRISTGADVFGKATADYQEKVDSLLFENIPGKILSQDTINVSGFTALDITNKTRLGDLQRYNIIFTPLELLICKVGGKKEFLNSAQPEAFFKELTLDHAKLEAGLFTPEFGGFSVWLPNGYRAMNYPSEMELPGSTFLLEAVGEDGLYYSVRHRQYHDFEYIEEDAFELEYLLEKIAEDKKLTVDTSFLVGDDRNRHFTLTNKKGNQLEGEVRLAGPNYYFLLTTAHGAAANRFFESFSAQPFQYNLPFEQRHDTTFHLMVESPVRVNNHDKFFLDIIQNGGGEEEDFSFEGEEQGKVIRAPNGESIQLEFATLNKFESWEKDEEFWKMVQEAYGNSKILYKDTMLESLADSTYLRQTHEMWFTDTNSTRSIRVKATVENQAIYAISATVDTLGYSSQFIEKAFQSFRPASDTLIGTSVLRPKNDLFFDQLKSSDSTLIYQAANSVWEVAFQDEDLPRLKDVFENYYDKRFKRQSRIDLLYQMVYLDEPVSPEYLKEQYYKSVDSADTQFGILKALVRLRTQESYDMFAELLLDEPPFDKNAWTHGNLFWDMNDTLELAATLFPDLLELADFNDYRPYVYELLADLIEADLIKTKHFKKRYSTFLRFAKVELKKQKSADMDESNGSNSNSDLLEYATILSRFSKKKEVQELFADMLKVRNKFVLAGILERINGHVAIPDSLWNTLAEEEKVRPRLYAYLERVDQLKKLDEKYRNQAAIAEGLARENIYGEIDSISLITSEPIQIKSKTGSAYFYRVKFEDDNLWRLSYVVFADNEEHEGLYTKALLVKRGEQFNPDFDNMDEIIADAVKEINLTGRDRVIQDNGYGYYDY